MLLLFLDRGTNCDMVSIKVRYSGFTLSLINDVAQSHIEFKEGQQSTYQLVDISSIE